MVSYYLRYDISALLYSGVGCLAQMQTDVNAMLIPFSHHTVNKSQTVISKLLLFLTTFTQNTVFLCPLSRKSLVCQFTF